MLWGGRTFTIHAVGVGTKRRQVEERTIFGTAGQHNHTSRQVAPQLDRIVAAIAHKQSIQWMIADMAAEVEALRSLIYRTAWMIDTGQPHTREAAICKLYGSEVGSRITDKALQIYGALGYSRHMPLERAFRDSRISEIFEGTNEIQRIVIASDIFQKKGVRIRP